MRYHPGPFGHLPEWHTSDRGTEPGSGLPDQPLSVPIVGDRVDPRPIRFAGGLRRGRRPR